MLTNWPLHCHDHGITGVGPVNARLMIIGIAPGFNEVQIGIPFVGQSGHLLDTLLKAAADLRRDMAVRRPGTVGQERGDREQLADVPDPPAVPRQRVRPDRIVAHGHALVRRVRAVHPGERDAARAADRNEDRRQPGHHDRLVRRDRGAVIRLVAATVRAGAEAAVKVVARRWRGDGRTRGARRNTPNDG